MAETQREVSQMLKTLGADVPDAETSSQGTEIEKDETSADPEDYRRIMDDLLYEAAANGNIEAFRGFENCLDQLVTPYDNSIVHINITARHLPHKKKLQFLQSKKNDSSKSKSEDSSLAFLKWVKSKCPSLLRKPNKKRETPLHIAARHGHTDIATLLLEDCKIQDVESGGTTETMLSIANIEGDTPIHEAVRYRHSDTVVLMMFMCEFILAPYDEKTNPPFMNCAEETPLYLAVEKGFDEIVAAILFFSSSPPHHGPNGRTALHAAVIRNDTWMTKVLLKKKQMLAKEPDKQGWIPLHYAAFNGYIDIVKLLLLDKSLAYETTSTGRQTALHLAAARGNESVMKELISKCPGCAELVDERDWNVLHFAVSSENEAAVRYILSNPWLRNLINQKNKDGETPLHRLAASGTFMSSFITHPKVDKLAFNNKHLTALDIISTKDDLWGPRKAIEQCLQRFVRRWGLRAISSADETDKNNKIEVEQGLEIDKKVTEGDSEDVDQASIDEVIEEGIRIITTGPEGFKARSDGKQERDETDKIIRAGDTKKGKDKSEDIMDYIKDAREAHLVVATLIATVVFAAGFTMPGGYKEDDPDEGAPVLTRRRAFQAFIIADTVAMMLSCIAVFIHLFMALEKNKAVVYVLFDLALKSTIGAMFAMMVAFITGMYAVLVHSSALAISACVLCSLFFLICWSIPADWKGLPDKIGKKPSLSFLGINSDKRSDKFERLNSSLGKRREAFKALFVHQN